MPAVDDMQKLTKDEKPGYILFYGKDEVESLSRGAWSYKGWTRQEGASERICTIGALRLISNMVERIDITSEDQDYFYNVTRVEVRKGSLTEDKLKVIEDRRMKFYIKYSSYRATIVLSISFWEYSLKELFKLVFGDPKFFTIMRLNPTPFIEYMKRIKMKSSDQQRIMATMLLNDFQSFNKILFSRGVISFQQTDVLENMLSIMFPIANRGAEVDPMKGIPITPAPTEEWQNKWKQLKILFQARHSIIHNDGIVSSEENTELSLLLDGRDSALVEELIPEESLDDMIHFMEDIIINVNNWMHGTFKSISVE